MIPFGGLCFGAVSSPIVIGQSQNTKDVESDKSRKQTVSVSSYSSVGTNNAYSELEDGVEEQEIPQYKKRKSNQHQNHSKNVIEKSKLPPPITVKSLSLTKLYQDLRGITLLKDDINIKLTQYGTKIYVKTTNQFQVLQKYLLGKNVKFFTHQLNEDKLTKFVLYGLPDYDVKHIKSELIKHEIDPFEIKKLNIKKSRYDSQTNYLCYFKKSSNVNLQNLRKIKSMFQIIVYWQYYNHNNNNITQCSNCQSFGHGSRNCHLDSVCVKCGKNHKSIECPLNKERNMDGKIPDSKLVCANCSQNHTASYQKCPKRLDYISNKKKYNKNVSSNSNFVCSSQKSHSTVAAPQLHNEFFPKITETFPKTQNAWQKSTNNNISNQSIPNQSNHNQTNLFTPDECFTIFKEFIQKLTQCATKQNQLIVIGEITFKYLN